MPAEPKTTPPHATPAITPPEPKFSAEPLKPSPGREPEIPAALAQAIPPAAKGIFMLAERLTPLENPDKPIINVHWRLGYWTDGTKAEAEAARRNLAVQEIKPGE